MGRYLVMWEVDPSRVPVDAKERGGAWSLLMAMIKQSREAGKLKDFGTFTGEINGFSVYEGTDVEVANILVQYSPYVSFKVHPLLTESQTNEVIKSLSG
jgi:hypothetical protein